MSDIIEVQHQGWVNKLNLLIRGVRETSTPDDHKRLGREIANLVYTVFDNGGEHKDFLLEFDRQAKIHGPFSKALHSALEEELLKLMDEHSPSFVPNPDDMVQAAQDMADCFLGIVDGNDFGLSLLECSAPHWRDLSVKNALDRFSEDNVDPILELTALLRIIFTDPQPPAHQALTFLKDGFEGQCAVALSELLTTAYETDSVVTLDLLNRILAGNALSYQHIKSYGVLTAFAANALATVPLKTLDDYKTRAALYDLCSVDILFPPKDDDQYTPAAKAEITKIYDQAITFKQNLFNISLETFRKDLPAIAKLVKAEDEFDPAMFNVARGLAMAVKTTKFTSPQTHAFTDTVLTISKHWADMVIYDGEPDLLNASNPILDLFIITDKNLSAQIFNPATAARDFHNFAEQRKQLHALFLPALTNLMTSNRAHFLVNPAEMEEQAGIPFSANTNRISTNLIAHAIARTLVPTLSFEQAAAETASVPTTAAALLESFSFGMQQSKEHQSLAYSILGTIDSLSTMTVHEKGKQSITPAINLLEKWLASLMKAVPAMQEPILTRINTLCARGNPIIEMNIEKAPNPEEKTRLSTIRDTRKAALEAIGTRLPTNGLKVVAPNAFAARLAAKRAAAEAAQTATQG